MLIFLVLSLYSETCCDAYPYVYHSLFLDPSCDDLDLDLDPDPFPYSNPYPSPGPYQFKQKKLDFKIYPFISVNNLKSFDS